ncbi:MAG: GTP-binding protein [Promethearchaeota archaeon]|nr:MAG: GTP-binding protein [Candidatus Lokiarchaeota archaeon]
MVSLLIRSEWREIIIPKSYKLKVILGGAQNSGKSSFIDGHPQNDSPIGVSFKPIECYANGSDNYKLIVWDLKDRKRFRFLFPYFCRGACAGIICFDLTSRDSFLEIDSWIQLFRHSIGDVPIIIIGTKSDLGNFKVTEGEVRAFIKKRQLSKFFFTSLYDENDTKRRIFKSIVKSIDPSYPLNDFSLFTPKDFDSEEFREFIQFFSACPICKRENHYDSLKNIYISTEPHAILLREQLYKAIDASRRYSIDKGKILKIGIPCCNCYEKIFSK